MFELIKGLCGSPPPDAVKAAEAIYSKRVGKAELERYMASHPLTLQLLNDAYSAKDWELYVDLHRDEYKTFALREAAYGGLSGKAYWTLLLDAFNAQHHVFVNIDRWKELFARQTGSGPRSAMSPGDLAVFDTLPDMLVAYRGARPTQVRGLSWTLDIEVANFFASRCAEGQVYVAHIPKRDVLAYLNEEEHWRSESEIIVLPTPRLRPSIYKAKKRTRATQPASLLA